MAFLIPADLFWLCLVKKLTVIGIIGKTQGVKSAANPLTNDKKKITSKDLFDVLFSCFTLGLCKDEVVPFEEHPFTLISKSSS